MGQGDLGGPELGDPAGAQTVEQRNLLAGQREIGQALMFEVMDNFYASYRW